MALAASVLRRGNLWIAQVDFRAGALGGSARLVRCYTRKNRLLPAATGEFENCLERDSRSQSDSVIARSCCATEEASYEILHGRGAGKRRERMISPESWRPARQGLGGWGLSALLLKM